MKTLKIGKRQALKVICPVAFLFFLSVGSISSVYGQNGVQTRLETNGPVIVSTDELTVRVNPGPVPLVFKRSLGNLATLTGTLWVQLPLIVYVMIWRFGGIFRVGNEFFQLMFQLIFQIWLLFLITYVIIKTKQLRIEKAFLVSILIHYFNIVIIQFIIP